MNLNGLKPVRSINLYEQVEEQLSVLFSSSNLRPGDKLPSERELQERLGVSRAVLREALRILEAKGLIEGKQGKGRFVRADLSIFAPMENENPLLRMEKATLIQIYEMRIVLEPSIVVWATQRSTTEDLQLLSNCLESLENSDHSNEADFTFHLTLAKASHNQMAMRTMQTLLETQLLYSKKLFTLIRTEYAIDKWKSDHEQILEAIKIGNGEKAAQIMRHHLERSYELIRES